MQQAKQLATRFREVLLDGLWIANTNFKHQLSSLDWQQATTQVGTLNTIAALTFHIDYYIAGVVNVFTGGKLEIKDKFSFDAPPIGSQEDWERQLTTLWNNAERFAELVELMSDEQLASTFVHPKLGSYQKNINAMTEHAYYHLGQIVLIRKLLNKGDEG